VAQSAQTIQHDLRLDAYEHLQELELAYFEERSTGRLISILVMISTNWSSFWMSELMI